MGSKLIFARSSRAGLFMKRYCSKLLLVAAVTACYCAFAAIDSVRIVYLTSLTSQRDAPPPGGFSEFTVVTTAQRDRAGYGRAAAAAAAEGASNGSTPPNGARVYPVENVPSNRSIDQRRNSNSSASQTGARSRNVSSGPRSVYRHKLNYTIPEKDFCERTHNKTKRLLLIVVHTHPAYSNNRQAIRDTWGGDRFLDEEIDIKVLFFLGSAGDPTTDAEVEEESRQKLDIVRANFSDTYRNLTYKVITWTHWISRFCPQADHVLKLDDDVFVNRFNVLEMARQIFSFPAAHGRRSVICRNYYDMDVVRDNESKWYVGEEDFPRDVYPWYCSGGAFFLSPDLPGLLYNASGRTRFFWVDDVYATGLLPETLRREYNISLARYELGSRWIVNHLDAAEQDINAQGLFIHLGRIDTALQQYQSWLRLLESWNLLKKPPQAAS